VSNIVLIGFMGAGKTAVGRRLAERAGARFLDTDREIERLEGMSVARIFEEQGEEQFRRAETSLLSSLADRNETIRTPRKVLSCVLSTGGGAPMRDENVALLKRFGHVIWLRTKPETIVQRVGHKISTRPIIADYGDNLIDRVKELQQDRYPRYEAVADSVIDTDDCATPDQASVLVYDYWKRNIATVTRHYDCNHDHS